MWVGEVKHAGGCQFHSSMQEVYNFWFHIEGEINHCGHDVVCGRVWMVRVCDAPRKLIYLPLLPVPSLYMYTLIIYLSLQTTLRIGDGYLHFVNTQTRKVFRIYTKRAAWLPFIIGTQCQLGQV